MLAGKLLQGKVEVRTRTASADFSHGGEGDLGDSVPVPCSAMRGSEQGEVETMPGVDERLKQMKLEELADQINQSKVGKKEGHD